MESKMPAGSATAKMAAAYRARASERSFPVCNDPWAKHIVGDEAPEILRLADSGPPEMELGVALRTAWIDEHVRGADVTQVVLLGAGLDTRSARLGRRAVRFFEVDHPGTQSNKRAALDRIEGYPRDAATFVPCDFENGDFVRELVGAGFHLGGATLVIWEGVLPYLTENAVHDVLRKLRRLTSERSQILFDWVGPASNGAVERVVGKVGEPFLFTISDMRPVLREAGFPRCDVTSMTEVCLARTGTAAPEARFFERWFLARVSGAGAGAVQ